MASRPLPDKFLVAFSFAGEQRQLVCDIAEAVEKELGWGKVFLYEWFQYYLGGSDADQKLQRIYGDQCELAIFCVSGSYGSKPWPLLRRTKPFARAKSNRAHRQTNDNEKRSCPSALERATLKVCSSRPSLPMCGAKPRKIRPK